MFESNNNIIESMVPRFVADVNSAKSSLGMHHNRTAPPRKSTFKYKRTGGEITRISIAMTKGEVMSHKGKGKYPDNRQAKPFYNPKAEEFLPELADAIAANCGDVICGNLCIR